MLLSKLIEEKAFHAASVLIEEGNLHSRETSAALLRMCTIPCKEQQAMVELLLDYGACPESKDSEGRTVLHIAYESKSPLRVVSLIASHANVNHLNQEGNTVLHLALQAADFEAVRMLLRNGANANQRNGPGQLPLMLAARHEHDDACFQLLTRFGARIEDVTDADDAMALILKSPEAAFVLLQRGLLSIMETVHGQDLDRLYSAFAQWCSWSSMARHEERFHALLFQSNKENDAPSLVDLFLSTVVRHNMNLPDGRGRTLLHYACEVHHKATVPFVQALIAKGAHVHTSDDHGSTPLHVALACGNLTAAMTLLALGADVSSVDTHGRSPLHVMVAPETGNGGVDDEEEEDGYDSLCAQLVDLCLYKGFDFRSIDRAGNLPFVATALNGSTTNSTLQFAMVHAAACQGLFR